MNKNFVVVTQTFYEPDMREAVLKVVESSFPIFRRQPGLRSIQIHHAHDKTHTLSLMVWESKAANDACMSSPDFNDFNPAWQKLLATGKVKFQYMSYDVLNSFVAA